MKIVIETIPHASQEYPTCGDWRRGEDGTLHIKVSEEVDHGQPLGNQYAILIAIHELIEVTLCEQRGITTEQVDQFDKAYEATRPLGDESEPGDAPDAPYRKEHFFATSLERLMAAELGVDWAEYEAAINKLP